MNEEQRSIFDKIIEDYENLMSEGIDYWARFSNLDTWQFWVNVVFLILPLIVIWFSINRRILWVLILGHGVIHLRRFRYFLLVLP